MTAAAVSSEGFTIESGLDILGRMFLRCLAYTERRKKSALPAAAFPSIKPLNQ